MNTSPHSSHDRNNTGADTWDVSEEAPVQDTLEQRQEAGADAPWAGEDVLEGERSMEAAEADEIDQRLEVDYDEDFDRG